MQNERKGKVAEHKINHPYKTDKKKKRAQDLVQNDGKKN